MYNELSESELDELEFYREFNKTIYEIKKRIKQDHCEICLKKCKGLCKSHTIPQFVLKNISGRESLYSASGLVMDSDTPKSFQSFHKKGVSNAGIFSLICRECDNVIFKEYENENNLRSINSLVCSEIVLKNILNDIYSKLYAREANKLAIENFGVHFPHEEANEYDYKELKKKLRRILKGLNGKLNVTYKILFNEILDYVVPIAYQGEIVLNYDLHGHLVNELMDFDIRHQMEGLEIVVFPFKTQSLVLVFYDESYKKLKSFDTQFTSLKLEEKLKIINYMIFRLTDSYYIEINTATKIKHNQNLRKRTEDFDVYINDTEGIIDERERRRFELKNLPDIPNLLCPEWALK